MPINTTTAFNPGDIDSGQTYSQVKITSFRVLPDAKQIELVCDYGNTAAGVFTRGKAPTIHHYIVNKPDDLDASGNPIPGTAVAHYDTIVAKTSAAIGEVYYAEVAKQLYQWLIDQSIYAGAIV